MSTHKLSLMSAAALGRGRAARVGSKPARLVAAALCGLALVGVARADEPAGRVRISDSPASSQGKVTPAAHATSSDPGAPPSVTTEGPVASPDGAPCQGNGACAGGAACSSSRCGIWHSCLFGPENGYGCRFLDWHAYCMAYPVNPWYYDARDTRVYAAAGYGAPITVPLAPTVQTQVNYGWGIPASRITPISRVAPQAGVLYGAVAPRPGVTDYHSAPVPPVYNGGPVPGSAPVPTTAPASH